MQYEQLLETMNNLFTVPNDLARPPSTMSALPKIVADTKCNDFELANEIFEGTPKLKRRLFDQPVCDDKQDFIEVKAIFELPIFTIQLQSELNDPLIDIVFREFNVNYTKVNVHETKVQVALKTLMMADLLQPPESKHRFMLVSLPPENQIYRPNSAYSSRSCPDLLELHQPSEGLTGSLPKNLESGFSKYYNANAFDTSSSFSHRNRLANHIAPPSQRLELQQDNLVLYTSIIVDSNCEHFTTKYDSLNQKSFIDFNSLDLIVSVKSWYAFLNFFGVLSDMNDDHNGSYNAENDTAESVPNEQRSDNSQLEMSIRSLTLTFVHPENEMAKVNVSNAHFVVTKQKSAKTVKGRLGSVSLFDLTSHGTYYRERFLTSGSEALNFMYSRDGPKNVFAEPTTLEPEAQLKIKMSSVRYVHTKRFVAQIQSFVNEFQGLQAPMLIRKIRTSESQSNLQHKSTKLSLSIKAGSPIILLPLSSTSNYVIVADLGEFSLRNSFHFASETDRVISVRGDCNGPNEILDVMQVDLVNTDLFAGKRQPKIDDGLCNSFFINDSMCMDMGNYIICKEGANLLNGKCHLKLIVERNLHSWRSHNVPDFSVQGTLSRLDAVLSLQQYKLIRGFLQYNLGEPLDDLSFTSTQNTYEIAAHDSESNEPNMWTSMSITLDLQNVSVSLRDAKYNDNVWSELEAYANDENTYTTLACINFIKSSLKIDIFSDNSQDIDLVSQEILITDSRFKTSDQTANKQHNVFTNILQPITSKSSVESVQAEVHSRKKQNYSKYTILLNNMRVMAILDWLESVRDFLSQDCEETEAPHYIPPKYSISQQSSTIVMGTAANEMEVILNITNSELVFVEQTDQWDTNAVILKSTTVLSFRPHELNKIMSLNLNHLEVFSCILGCEEETALSIIDPITINIDWKLNTLDVQLQKRLCVRLSYNDLKLFMKMIESLPNQTRNAKSREERQINEALINKLVTLGFSVDDCVKALEMCNNRLDDSALWLTQNAKPITEKSLTSYNSLNIQAIEIRANCISLCIIDDCKDADVPLLEFSLSDLEVYQEIGPLLDISSLASIEQSATNSVSISRGSRRAGHLKGVFGSDYYNRILSGWEPLIESWKCKAEWNYSLGAPIQPNRLRLEIISDDLLKLNCTTTIIELFNLVYENWTQDYYGIGSHSSGTSTDMSNYRRRNPFVPFALKNDTGQILWFSTIVSTPGGGIESTDVLKHKSSSQQWITVEPGTIVPFSFGPMHKQRHRDTHASNLHQIAVHVDGWTEVGPVSIDKVGVFFRYARRELTEFVSLTKARIVFSVTLEGSAQKLVTIRSALRVTNKLNTNVLLKMEHLNTGPEAMLANLAPDETYSVPLSHVNSHLYVAPVTAKFSSVENADMNEFRLLTKAPANETRTFFFCERSIYWPDMGEGHNVQQWFRTCKSSRNKCFRMVVAIYKENYPIKDFSTMPGHSIVLLPPLRLHNLLPCDLLYKLSNETQGRISPSETANVYEIDLENASEITFALDNYPTADKISISSGLSNSADYRIRLRDTKDRPLVLRASVQISKGKGLQITISAPYWLINRTGLPLIFRQEGVPHESSGQFNENEQARLVSPLMFSFTDPDASPALTVRLGKRYGPSPPWCQAFNLHKDIQHQHLKSGSSNETFVIGTEVRCGRGRYAKTRVVTLSPRFQLYNRSSYKLQFSQKCFTESSVIFKMLVTYECFNGGK